MSENRQEKNSQALGQGKLYRALSTTSFVGVFAAFAIIIFSIVLKWNLNAYLWGAIASIAILSLGIISSLPWIRRIEKQEFKKVSIIFAAFIGICVLLWLISLWMIVIIIAKQNADSSLWFAQVLKITILVSLQLMVATFVGNVVIKCGKTMIIVQAISYLSYVFVDFYLSYLLFCININPTSSNPITINTNALGFLGHAFMIALFILALVYCLISNAIIKSIENRRIKAMTEDMILNSKKEQAADGNGETPEQKLAKLKDLYDKQLITEEDYNKKRDDILNQL